MDKNPIKRAIDIAVRYGSIDGSHHKDWVIDQMVRALTNCPIEIVKEMHNGKKYEYERQGESEEYKKLVVDTENWEVGIAP